MKVRRTGSPFFNRTTGFALVGAVALAGLVALPALAFRSTAPPEPVRHAEAGMVRLPRGISVNDVLGFGMDVDQTGDAMVTGLIFRDGSTGVATIGGRKPGQFLFSRLPGSTGMPVRSVYSFGSNEFSVLWEDGTAALYILDSSYVRDSEGNVQARAWFTRAFDVRLEEPTRKYLYALLTGSASEYRVVAVRADGNVYERTVRPAIGEPSRQDVFESECTVDVGRVGKLLSGALNDQGILFLGTDKGRIVLLNLSADAEEEASSVTVTFPDSRPVTALRFLADGRSLVVGDATGCVSVWNSRCGADNSNSCMAERWEFTGGIITAISPAARGGDFFVLGAAGTIHWLFTHSPGELLRLPATRPPAIKLAASRQGDGFAALHSDGSVQFHFVTRPRHLTVAGPDEGGVK